MEPISRESAQAQLERFMDKDVYLHLETTNGAYAALNSENTMAIAAYIRNGLVRFERAVIAGHGPYRVGLKMNHGWVYAEGLTDWEVDDEERLLLAGHDSEGRIAISLQLSMTPFPM